jgi:hypothetical protein
LIKGEKRKEKRCESNGWFLRNICKKLPSNRRLFGMVTSRVAQGLSMLKKSFAFTFTSYDPFADQE